MNNTPSFLKSIELAGLVAAVAVMMTACSNSSPVIVPASTGTGNTTTPLPTTFVQIERLGRPAINEGLVITNDFLNAFNSISPSLDLSDAAAPVRAEAVATLNAVDMADSSDNVDAGAVATAFFPDVMRVDTTIDVLPNESLYDTRAAVVNTLGAPIGGRKLEDDVIDVTLSALVGAAVSDGVPYNRPVGNSNPSIGHNLLEGQTVARGTARFPFLAAAN